MTKSRGLADLSITEVLTMLHTGRTTATELLEAHLRRIDAFDRTGPTLNSVVVPNPAARAEAQESDGRYAAGAPHIRPLEGVPFTVKDSYQVAGLTVANGSPAFSDLIASDDAFAVAALRAAGAVLIGKTNMPPMAAGGMQRGLYGRSESPFNPDYLPAAYASGSSHGSAVATAAGFCMFGMAEETVSSGRSPASNNSLVAYTPSRGLISIRGNWPLFPTSDVVVPHCRSVDDMLHVLEVLLVPDASVDGDLWRQQAFVSLPTVNEARPKALRRVVHEIAGRGGDRPLAGVRFGAPTRYTDASHNAAVVCRPSVRDRWELAWQHLESLGAEIIDCELPVMSAYEGRFPAANDLDATGEFPQGWMAWEYGDLMRWGWDQFLRSNAESALRQGLSEPTPASLAATDGTRIFPLPAGALPDRYDPEAAVTGANGDRHVDAPAHAERGLPDPFTHPDFAAGLRALERFRRTHFEEWLSEQRFDGIVFPANGDVGEADADRANASADHAWRDGVLYSNGNYALRHLGIPTVTIPMGAMGDTGMPIGLTFASSAYRDVDLLAWALASERPEWRVVPPRTPPLEGEFAPAREPWGALRSTRP